MGLSLPASEFECQGWKIYFHPLFNEQFQDLMQKVEGLKQKLSEDDFPTHPTVKTLKALLEGIKNKIPLDPFASHFALRKPLQKYCRLKKMGLNERYRLFFKPYKEDKAIIILWLGYPRKAGDDKDCYEVFKRMVSQGKFPDSFKALMALCEQS